MYWDKVRTAPLDSGGQAGAGDYSYILNNSIERDCFQ